jgi:N-acetyl-alpha-D-muramate 1-phosphate uridylyltransferase
MPAPTSFKAMILAAGLGERMRPLTNHTPKPLLKAGGKALIVWQIERLRAAGFIDLIINHAHLGQQIEDELGDGSAFDVRIQYSREAEPLDTAGGIANALELLGEAPFLVTNGDVYAEFDYASVLPALTDMAFNPHHLAHLILVDNPLHHPVGDFSIRDGKVIDTAAYTFSGIGGYRPELFANIIKGSKAKLAPLLKAAMAAGQVTGEHFSGRWEDVGTPARLSSLHIELNQTHPHAT